MINPPIPYMLVGQPELSEQTMRALELKADLPQYVEAKYQLGVTVQDWTLPEYWWLRRGRTYRSGGVTGPVAAQLSYQTLNLVSGPLPGTQMAIVDSVLISNTTAAAGQYQAYLATPAVLGGLINAQQADDRQVGPPAFEVRGNSAVAAPVSLASQVNVFIPAGSTFKLDGPWILTGNAMLVVLCLTVNTSVAVTIQWKERAMLTSER